MQDDPVQSTPWDGAPSDSLLFQLPWFEVDMGDVTATAHLFFGSRPLVVGGLFPDGNMRPKVLWTFSERMDLFTVTGTLLNADGYDDVEVMETGPANTSTGSSTDWPSMFDLPAAGCWEFHVTGSTSSGVEVEGSFVYIVVE